MCASAEPLFIAVLLMSTNILLVFRMVKTVVRRSLAHGTVIYILWKRRTIVFTSFAHENNNIVCAHEQNVCL